MIKNGIGLLFLGALLKLVTLAASGKFDRPDPPSVTPKQAAEAQQMLNDFVEKMEREHPEEWRRTLKDASDQFNLAPPGAESSAAAAPAGLSSVDATTCHGTLSESRSAQGE